ncbi:unnamed protein product [Blepharisma stoltei]|uniref:RNA polymerase II assembly factor Rtp1 C-terminal domain-containing protein n=1 Tax=Blepharisma stoltei TaxID=1481888 RepID=A0AAU9JJE3_9CILI|nr:unnamed protein product [Blepharisma stoltei]
MEKGYEKLSKVLGSDKSNKLDFLEKIIECVFQDYDCLPEEFEAQFSKSVVYLLCWILLPRIDPPPLPQDLLILRSQLDIDTSSLSSILYSKLIETYNKPGIPETYKILLYNDTLISISLLIPKFNTEFLSVLLASDSIPPLLWILTYTQYASIAIQLLPRAIIKKDGVKELINSFGKGDNKDKLKNLAVKVLTSPPNKWTEIPRDEYVRNICDQAVDLMINHKCDAYVDSILSETANILLNNYPDEVLNLFLRHIMITPGEIESKMICLEYLMKYNPPHRLILYHVSNNFAFFMNAYEYLQGYKALLVNSTVNSIMLQFFKYWPEASHQLYDYVSQPDHLWSFTINDDGQVFAIDTAPDPIEKIDFYNKITNLIELLSSSPLSEKACADLFSMLLQRFNESSPLDSVYLIVYMVQNLGQERLLMHPKHMSFFLTKMLDSQDPSILEITLTILSMSLAGVSFSIEDKSFLIQISPKVIDLTSHQNLEIKQLAGAVNSMISQAISQSTIEVTKDDKYADIYKDLSSKKPYERALGLFRISTLIKNQEIEIPWSAIENAIEDEDTFVFGNLVKAYMSLFTVKRELTLQRLKTVYRQASVLSKEKIMEIIYQLIRMMQDKTILVESSLFVWMISLFSTEEDEMLRNGIMSVIAELVKYGKGGISGGFSFVMRSALNSVKISSARVQSAQPVDGLLVSALKLIAKAVKHVPIEILQDDIQDIHDSVHILEQFYKKDDNISILIKSILIKLESLYSELLGTINIKNVPYDFGFK